MPAVPKPSQAEKKVGDAKPMNAEKTKAQKKVKLFSDKANHYAEIKALAMSAGGLTPEAIHVECELRKLAKKTAGNYVCYLRRDGCVKDAAKC